MIRKIEKTLRKLDIKKQDKIAIVSTHIKNGTIGHLDVKKIQGYENRFRIRVGDMRIIFDKTSTGNNIVAISPRNERTYDF